MIPVRQPAILKQGPLLKRPVFSELPRQKHLCAFLRIFIREVLFVKVMGLLVRHSAGRRSCSRKKMLSLFLWFFFSEMFGDVFSAVALGSKGNSNVPPSTSREVNKNITSVENNAESPVYADSNSNSYLHRVSKALPQDRNSYENLADIMLETDKNTEDVQKAPTKLMTLFVIPYLRPGRSEINGNLKSANSKNIFKLYDSFVPSFRFHADDEKTHIITPNGVLEQSISDSYNEEDGSIFSLEESIGGDYFYDSRDKETKYDNKGVIEDSVRSVVRQKRETGNHDTVIPYPRAGRTTPQNYKGENIKEESKQAFFDIFASPTMYESEKPNQYSYVLPYPRPGRSYNYNGDTETSESLLDSQRESILEFSDVKVGSDEVDKMQQESTPLSQAFNKKSLQKDGRKGASEDLFSSSFILSPDLKGISQNSKDASDDSTSFIIPYPRPGKKSMLIINSPRAKQKSDKEGEGLNDYVLPYPRPGKKSFPRLPVKNSKNNDNENEIVKNYILPYPRPGRSEFVLGDMKDDIYHDINEDNASVFNTINLNKVLNTKESAIYDENKDTNLMLPNIEPLKSDTDTTDLFTDNYFPLIYKRSNAVIPYPRLGRSAYVLSYPGTNYDISFPRLKRSNSIVPYPRVGRSNSVLPDTRRRKSDTVVPYPRLGRSNSVVPYPRLGRSNSVVPYPRPGRSDYAVPYPRSGRSHSLLSFSRGVRTNSVVPYPRLGRSDSLIPYPRPGRSNSVVPYPRLGRSNSVVPYPRLGRSDSVVPYPRLGRSNSVVPYPRLGRSDSVVPYPRLGRSDTVVPYPRPGRSDSVVPYPRLGRSDSVVPYPRLGRSYSVVPYPRLGRSDTVVPYPRPGRSDSVVPYHPRQGRSDSVVPYPRLGRADSVVPYPRLGRSDSLVPYPRPGRSNSVVPYPRPGRSNSVVPYPRPGRYTSVEPYLNMDRSLSVISNQKERKPLSLDFYQRKSRSDKLTAPLQNSVKTGKFILPNLRPGRSESEREIFFTVPNPKTDETENAQNLDSIMGGIIRKDIIVLDPKIRLSEGENGEFIWPQTEPLVNDERVLRTRNVATDTVIPYPRLGRSEEQVTPSPDLTNTAHKLNKHMLSSVDDSIYLLPYPRPGRRSF